MNNYEFYETPEPLTRWLMSRLRSLYDGGIHGRRCFEPCVGDGAIVRAAESVVEHGRASDWMTNDIDPRWCGAPMDATRDAIWQRHAPIDWTITNPPFSLAVPILQNALEYSRVGVAMYLRVSIHEPLKEGTRRWFFGKHRPRAILFLPRFAHQRSKTKGIWSTDSMTSCWVVWQKDSRQQVIDYAPESVIDELADFTTGYRERMDQLMGLSGTELDRQAQVKARFKGVKAVA